MNKEHRHTFARVILICLFIAILCSGWTKASAVESPDYNSVIVIPKKEFRRAENVMRQHGIYRFRKIKEKMYVIPLNENEKESKISELKQSGLYELVEPDYFLSLNETPSERNYLNIKINPNFNNSNSIQAINPIVREITPNDRDFFSQYYLREINADKAWSLTTGSENIKVGVLDTGIDRNHPDLAGKIAEDEVSEDDLTDEIGHGTEVAGIIAAKTNNNQGIAGISWNTKIVPIKVTDETGQARVSTVVSALDAAHEKGVKIVQISLSTNQLSQVLGDAVKTAQDRGIIIVSTGGNTGIRELRYPAAFNGVVGVTSVDQNKKIESYSTQGEHISIAAPGSNIYTTTRNSSYASVTGTSFAAPQVAGTLALIWALIPDFTSSQVKDILFKSAQDLGESGKDPTYGYGLLNSQKAVELALVQVAKPNELQAESNSPGNKTWNVKF